ncbi:MAG TPA: preprotein translocase subunit SecA [Alphaproteobacteria bacterium]|nr:preprotein translocase subunit SecA [Alphaproteobacteria bacterium]
MITSLARKFFGSHNERILRAQDKTVAEINSLEPEFQKLTDEQLRSKTAEFKARIEKGEKLDDLLPEAFATVREAAKRVLGQRPFDVQLRGGMVLHEGKIAEMKTGEGKTLVATLPSYLNALSGKGVHVVTVNDYLAKRDSGWMGRIYEFLGLTTGCIVHGLDDEERKAAYAADITYGTNNEFGFDYLRDNMKFAYEDLVQRPFNYAIVDEVDSILVDEARTPLIISGPAEDSSDLYMKIDALIPQLVEGDYEKDEKNRTVSLTEAGNIHIEQLLGEVGLLAGGGLYDAQNVQVVHHVNQALRAHTLFARDVDYIVKNDKVVIIDEFTGRMMEGRRYSEGLHQALEAKEHTQIQRENQTLASITFQNYFRLYPKLSGMTGTALTEAAEFAEIYNLEVVEMPTNVDVKRDDMHDEVYGTLAEKNEAIIKLIEECRQKGQPVLVGTVSIEKSEQLADLLKQRRIPHNVLNARFHDQEATIIAQAGRPGAVTIATNMAGRGTDIKLGGNVEMRIAEELKDVQDDNVRAHRAARIEEEVEADRAKALAAGGLFVIGTERHESRRIDNQLRGRSGRQGDPGASIFFLSLQDDLMRIFGAHNQTQQILAKLGLRDGEKIAHPWITTALAKAQQKVESRNFDMRKNLLKFDNIMNDQRKVIYEQRRDIMAATDVTETIKDLRDEVIHTLVSHAIPPHSYAEQWDLPGLKERVKDVLALDLPIEDWGKENGIAETEIEQRIAQAVNDKVAEKMKVITPESMRRAERAALLGVLDQSWKDHLLALDQLRQGIHLRGYGQRDPLNEYSREAFGLFQLMLDRIREDVTKALMHAEVRLPSLEEIMERSRVAMQELHGSSPDADAANPFGEPLPEGMVVRHPNNPRPAPSQRPVQNAIDPNDPETWHHTARNAPCPCGSGKKYKHCHGTSN